MIIFNVNDFLNFYTTIYYHKNNILKTVS